MKRKYKTGTRWCAWRWTNYGHIERLHLIQTPLFAIAIHWLTKPDPERWQHDHPVTFLSLIIRGAYWEQRGNRIWVKRTWFNLIKASFNDTHKIVKVLPNTTTLCFMGPKTREWGYHTDQGWISWKMGNL